MGTYIGLPGVSGGKLESNGFDCVRTVSGFMAAIRSVRVCAGAGDRGAVTLWIDDDGLFRCEFSRWGATINHAQAKTKKAVRTWLKEWLPHLTTQPKEASVANRSDSMED